MTAIPCDNFGFMNGIYALEQANWARYWNLIIPDGVVASIADELEVVPSGTYLSGVKIKSGTAMVDNHRVWLTSDKDLQLPDANATNPRYDLIVIRITYADSGESTAVLDYIQGTAAAPPTIPVPTQVTGTTYEISLAYILRPANTNTVTTGNIFDARFIFNLTHDDASVREIPVSSSAGTVTPGNDREYRTDSVLTSLTVNLPVAPRQTYITSLCYYTSSSSFSGVTFQLTNGNSYTPYQVGDSLNILNRRYNLVIWWDGQKYWVAAKASV